MQERSPAQLYALVFGVVLVAAGIMGFFYSSDFGSPGDVDGVLGILDVNGWHNVVHIVTGGLGLLAFSGGYYYARQYAFGLGAVYIVVAIWGFIVGDGDAILSIIPVNTEDNILHALIAAVSLAIGFGSRSVPMPSTHEPGPGFRFN